MKKKLTCISLLITLSVITGCTSLDSSPSVSSHNPDISSNLSSASIPTSSGTSILSSVTGNSSSISGSSSSIPGNSSSIPGSSSSIPGNSSSSTPIVIGNHYPMDAIYNEYYENIDFNAEKTALKSSLTALMTNNHIQISYSNTNYRIIDRDWKLSPDESDPNPYMHLIYATFNGTTSKAKRFNDANTVWDKEHIWAKAHGDFGTSKGAGTDYHHIRASDKINNNRRGNLDFCTVSGGTAINDYSGTASGYIGSNCYMPQKQDRGDVARAVFYMATRYAGGSLNLTIMNTTTSMSTGNGRLGILDDLLLWHEEDPVDEFEMHRNNLIYEDYQKNRNVYIDHPELVSKIFA